VLKRQQKLVSQLALALLGRGNERTPVKTLMPEKQLVQLESGAGNTQEK
jgi:hypothetical protein